jgi:hypothetical protein
MISRESLGRNWKYILAEEVALKLIVDPFPQLLLLLE